MSSFTPLFLEQLHIPHRLIKLIGEIARYQGKQALFQEKSPKMLQNLRQQAIIESVDYSNRLENIIVTPKELDALVRENKAPEVNNRPQAEVAGYRDVLLQIHESYHGIPFTDKVVLQFHRDLMRYTVSGGGTWKHTDNAIVARDTSGHITQVRFQPVAPFQTPSAMAMLHQQLTYELTHGDVDALLLIPLYVLDFLCIHPFADGNGRMSRLLTTLLLYHQGYEVARYVSIEHLVERSKESYYDTLYTASQGWHESQHDPLPFMEYLLGLVLGAYRTLEERAHRELDAPEMKSHMVEKAIHAFKGQFTFSDLVLQCPLVSKPMVRVVLNQLKAQGILQSEGKGRAAYWFKPN
ncbi:MAG: Fic family protein [Vampirovibrionales bacterium]